MGFLCSQGRIRMELVMGLLIGIGTMLECSEGIRCYTFEGFEGGSRGTWNCTSKNACYKATGRGTGKYNKRTFIKLNCAYVNKPCVEEKFGTAAPCVKAQNATELETFNNCNAAGPPTTTEQSLQNNTDNADGRNSLRKETVNVKYDTYCICYTDLCNPAGRLSPNPEVILGILVAAVLSAFNIGTGSF